MTSFILALVTKTLISMLNTDDETPFLTTLGQHNETGTFPRVP